VPCGLQRFVSGLRQIKNGTKRCSPHRNFRKTMCTYMDKCRCAVVIWLWHKFFRFWGKLCAMRCPSYFRRFPFRPRSPRFRLAPSQRSSPQAISHGLLSVHDVHASVSLPPNGALHKLFPAVSCQSRTPGCPRFRLAPSQRSSPQAISHSFLSIHDVHASVSLPPNGTLPKLFPTVSCPSMMSALPFPRFPVRPRCPRFHLAPPATK